MGKKNEEKVIVTRKYLEHLESADGLVRNVFDGGIATVSKSLLKNADAYLAYSQKQNEKNPQWDTTATYVPPGVLVGSDEG